MYQRVARARADVAIRPHHEADPQGGQKCAAEGGQHVEPPPPELAPSCAEAGVLGVLPGIVGTIQATEAIKLILGIGEPLIGRMVHFDALKMKFREFNLRRDPDCPVCGAQPTISFMPSG